MRLLLVDDEFFVRERILKQLDWRALNIDELREAANGTEAIHLMQNFRPDILLTDVRMPQMDGIKLAEEVSRFKPDCKIIFISGYSDVPYLRSAIRLHAVSYVEKPIDMEELAGSIRSATQELYHEQMAENGLMILQQKDQLSRLESIAKGLVQTDMTQGAVETLRKAMDISAMKHFVTVIIHLVRGAEEDIPNCEDIMEILPQAFPADVITCLSFVKQDRAVVHLLSRSASIRRHDVMDQYFHTLTNLLSLRGLSAVYSVGQYALAPEGLPESYNRAQQTLARCYYKRPGHVCYYQAHNLNSFDLESISLSEFSHALKKETSHAILFLVRSITANIKVNDATPPGQVIRFFYSVIVLLIRAAEKANVVIFDDFDDEYQVWEHINRLDFLDMLCDFLAGAIERYYAKLQCSATNNSVVNRIIRYLEQNYQNPDLSITMISESMKLSSTYICHLFKSTTGITLGSYLTKLRINKALELMERGEYRVKDIARMVGYRNGNYFSYKFKRRMGYSPSGTEN